MKVSRKALADLPAALGTGNKLFALTLEEDCQLISAKTEKEASELAYQWVMKNHGIPKSDWHSDFFSDAGYFLAEIHTLIT